MSIPETTVAANAAGARGLRLWRFDATLPVWIGAALFVLLLMLLPLGAIFITSVYGEKGLALGNYVEVFTDPAYLKAVWNSVLISFWVGVIAVAVGSLLGWLVTRTDLPFKRAVRALVMASFVTPPFLGAFAWMLLAGPNAGLLNNWYRAASGFEGALFNIFTIEGLIFVMALYSFPYVFSMIANVSELISSDLQDAANILGPHKHPRREQGEDRAPHHAAAPRARADRRLHRRVSPLAFALRRPRHPRTAGGDPHDHDADLGLLPVSPAARSRRGVLRAAAARNRLPHRGAETAARPAGLQHRRRQRRPEAAAEARLSAVAGVPAGGRDSVAVGLPSVRDSLESRAFEGLGDAAHAR